MTTDPNGFEEFQDFAQDQSQVQSLDELLDASFDDWDDERAQQTSQVQQKSEPTWEERLDAATSLDEATAIAVEQSNADYEIAMAGQRAEVAKAQEAAIAEGREAAEQAQAAANRRAALAQAGLRGDRDPEAMEAAAEHVETNAKSLNDLFAGLDQMGAVEKSVEAGAAPRSATWLRNSR